MGDMPNQAEFILILLLSMPYILYMFKGGGGGFNIFFKVVT